MSELAASRGPAHFERLYAANPDPWNLAASEYERHKYELTITALRGRRFHSALEVGCSIGILTYRLAGQCDALLALDIVASALAEAKQRCAELPRVSFANMCVPGQWPAETFDLILLSEMLYFLTPADITLLAARVCASLLPNSSVLLVNYTEQTDDPCNGDEAAETFIAASLGQLSLINHHHEDKFRIDLLMAV